MAFKRSAVRSRLSPPGKGNVKALEPSSRAFPFTPSSHGPVAQLGERSVRIREVESSNLFRSTNWTLDEHLLLERRFCRFGVALMSKRIRRSRCQSLGRRVLIGVVSFTCAFCRIVNSLWSRPLPLPCLRDKKRGKLPQWLAEV